MLAYLAPPLEAAALLRDLLFHLFARARAANKLASTTFACLTAPHSLVHTVRDMHTPTPRSRPPAFLSGVPLVHLTIRMKRLGVCIVNN